MAEIIELLVVSMVSGFGTALGNYLATRSLIKHIDKENKGHINV